MAVCLSLPAYSCLCRSDDDPLSGGMDFGNKSSFAPRWWKNIRLTRLTTFMLS